MLVKMFLSKNSREIEDWLLSIDADPIYQVEYDTPDEADTHVPG